MRDQAALGGLVVVGRDHQRGIGADLLGVLDQAQALARAVRPGARDHRKPPGRKLDDRADDGFVLGMAERGAFASGADGDDARRPFIDVPVDKFLERVHIDFAVFQRRDEGGN